MLVLHPNEQHSSLGISKALQDETWLYQEGETHVILKKTLSDSMFKVPRHGDNIYHWTRFFILLYYNKLSINMFGLLNKWEWYNRIDDFIILGALPTPSQIKNLHKKHKVDTIVNLCYEFPGYEKLYKFLNIRQIRIPIPDFTTPTVELIQTAINQIIKTKQQNPKSKLYLHCKAGKSRSAVIALCYLLRSYKLDLIESQNLLISKRSEIDKNLNRLSEVKIFYKELLLDIEIGKYSRLPYK